MENGNASVAAAGVEKVDLKAANKPKILITGASGFIGGALLLQLQERGFAVLKVSRHPSSPDELYWNPDQDHFPLQALEGLAGVVHLAGENIASMRWSKKKKERIFLSRVRTTRLLSHALVRLKTPPRFFFSASAVGYYGNRGDEILTEQSGQGEGLLANVCVQWEEAAAILKDKGIRVIHGRFGNVLDPTGGILQKIVPLFRWGLGAQLGNGHQWMSWISRDDLLRAIEWIVCAETLEGAFNCTSPHPVTQKEWAQFLAQKLHRPLLFKIPPSFVRFLFGQMGEELFLTSIRTKPLKLLQSGFQFHQPLLADLRF